MFITIKYNGVCYPALIANTFLSHALGRSYDLMQRDGKYCYEYYKRELKIMGILNDIEETLLNGDKILDLMKEKEELIFDLLIPGTVNVVVTDYNLPTFLGGALKVSRLSKLVEYKSREIVSIDCSGLTKGDAYGWMVKISKLVAEKQNPIIIIENISEMPSGPLCDDPEFVENLLCHSWKNEDIIFNGNTIDRRELTVILTTRPCYKDMLCTSRYQNDNYSWLDNFDKELEALDKIIKAL